MPTVDLCDITESVSGWYRPASVDVDDLEPELSELTGDPLEVPDSLSIEAAVTAIDAVLTVYPDAVWSVSGTHGRIVAGDRLVSLAVPLVDDDCEALCWIDAAGRLGDGQQWRACMWHERASDRPGKGSRNPSERVCQSPG